MRGLIRRAAVASDALAGAGQSLGGAPGHLYWANANNGTIAAVPLAGGTVTTLVPESPGSPGATGVAVGP